jgi:hypothetical protein
MEQVSFRVHVRAVAFASKCPTSIRRLVEFGVLITALATWALIAGLHTTYLQTPSSVDANTTPIIASAFDFQFGLESRGNCLAAALTDATGVKDGAAWDWDKNPLIRVHVRTDPHPDGDSRNARLRDSYMTFLDTHGTSFGQESLLSPETCDSNSSEQQCPAVDAEIGKYAAHQRVFTLGSDRGLMQVRTARTTFLQYNGLICMSDLLLTSILSHPTNPYNMACM